MELRQSVSDMITRCPKCQTSFRITQSQLQTAKGSVRCGSCLHIFKAMDNLVQNKAQASTPTKRVESEDVVRPPRKPAGIKPQAERAKTQANESLTSIPPIAAGVVSPLPAKSNFEYHKPKAPPVSTQEIEQALRSSIEPEKSQQDDALDADEKGLLDDLEEETFDEMDLVFSDDDEEPEDDTDEDLVFDDDVNVDLPNVEAASTFSFSEEIPAPTESSKPKKAASDQDKFGISDESLDLNQGDSAKKNDGQQNMLSFDQAAIDRNTGEYPAVKEEDFLISDDMATDDDEPISKKEAYGEDLVESFLDMDTWTPKESSLFDRKSKPPKEEEDNDDRHDPDESWAIDLLDDDDEDEGPRFSKTPSTMDELDLEMDDPDYEPPEEEYSRATTGSFNALEDSDIEEALGEPLGEHIEPKFAEKKNDEDELYPEFAYPKDDYKEDFNDEYNEDYSESYDDEDYSGDYYSEKDRSALLKGIRPAPVEFTNYGGNRDWRKTLIWGGSITAGLLLLVLQVAWLQFDTLSRQQPYRSLYSFFCPVFACEVPSMAAPHLIKASNLVVRSHPNAENALMVDTILLNTASFNQPFPDVVLNFSNDQGQTLSARRFKPGEYLGGELAGQSQMPVGQPVHLTLEIVDPGPEAVSYSAYIPN